MNKTIIINIGNSIIHIEEEAYEILMVYLNEIKQHFAKTADDFEIVKDIENRIAEMFAEILQKAAKQVIEVADVQSVITQMGSVQDFTNDDEEEVKSENFYANYHAIKKLYRDTDEGVIAGVCAGLGHYLNVEARWLRLAFFLLTFLAGSSILVYLILWIAIPRASSRSERMEMKGEATNLYGYKKNFDEELAAFKANMKSANKQFKPMVSTLHDLITGLFKTIGRLINAIGRLLGKLFAWFIIIFGFVWLVAFIVMLGLLLGTWENGVYNNFPFNIINVPYKVELIFAAFFTIFIPVLALVLLAIKLVFNHIQLSKYFSFLLLGVWIIAAVTTAFNVAKVVSSFNEEAEMAKNIDLKQYKRYVFNVDPGMVFTAQDSTKYNLGNGKNEYRVLANPYDHGMFKDPKNVRLVFEKTDNEQVSMVQSFKANGRNFDEALANSQNLTYKFQITDSVVTLTPKAILKKAAAWRDQSVVLTVKLPVGTQVLLNNDLYSYLKFYYYCDHGDSTNNAENELWVMTSEGLKCKYELDHPKKEETN